MDVRAVRQALLWKLDAVEDRAGHHIFFYLDYRGKGIWDLKCPIPGGATWIGSKWIG